MVSFTPRPLYSQGKRPRYPLDRKLGGPITVLNAVVKSPCRESNPIIPIIQPIASYYTD
jgi:hypothetical protein